VRGSRLEVNINVRFLREGVFDIQNIITIPHAKLLRKLGSLSSEQLMQLEKVLLFWLGFEDIDFPMQSVCV
jgi:mRNA interferase MazF